MRNRAALGYMAPALAIVAITVVAPIAYALYMSLTNFSLIRPGSGEFVAFSNYASLLGGVVFQKAFVRTVVYATGVVAFELILGVALAHIFSKGRSSYGVLRTLFLAPMILTPAVVSLMWKYMYQSDYGLANFLINQVGITEQTWTSSPKTSLLSAAIVDVWQWTPFMFLVAFAAIQSIPEEVTDAARVDGASDLKILFLVTLPMTKNIILVGILLRFMEAFRTFDVVFILTRGGPGDSSELLSIHAYLQGLGQNLLMGRGTAVGMYMLLVSVLVSAVLIRIIRKERG